MSLQPLTHASPRHVSRQRGSVLFFTLIALVAMTLATLVLVRSVDTNTLISGNLAFRQAATTSADAGVEAAIVAMTAVQTANIAKNVYMDTTHAFNVTSATTGYYSNADPTLNLTATSTWTNETSSDEVTDSSGNKYRYIIQRMCRTANQVLSTSNCLFTGPASDSDPKNIPLPSDMCPPSDCPKAAQTPQYRVTVRVQGLKDTVSYIQAVIN